LELSVFYELETSDPSRESVRRIYKECVEQVQLEGRSRVTDGEFMNGARIVPGESFGA